MSHILILELGGRAKCSCGKWSIKEPDIRRVREAFEKHKMEAQNEKS